MNVKQVPSPPAGLSTARQALWRSVVADYELESHHLEVLRLFCESLDRAELAEAAIAEHGLLVEGRYGVRQNPAVAVKAQAEALAARLLHELRLDEEPDPARIPRGVKR